MSMYFENDKTIKSNKQKIKINYKTITLEFYTNNGIFSKGKFDYGSRLLIESLPIEQMKGKILDLGCGYGPIGIYLAKQTNCQINMVDINERAIKLTQENLELNKITNAQAFISDIYENITTKYDYIITNPPIRAGKDTIRKFLLEARAYLNNDGQLWFVMRKDHGVKSMLKELETFYESEIIKREKGFYIIKNFLKNNQ